MSLARALSALCAAKLSLWRLAWDQNATEFDHAALAALVVGGIGKLLGLF